MKYMSLQEIAAACGGTYYGGSEFLPREVSSVVIDSRKAEKDSLFIAIRGARVDGHSFIPKVMEQGALAPFPKKISEMFIILILKWRHVNRL